MFGGASPKNPNKASKTAHVQKNADLAPRNVDTVGRTGSCDPSMAQVNYLRLIDNLDETKMEK
jgi:hypothetical protein